MFKFLQAGQLFNKKITQTEIYLRFKNYTVFISVPQKDKSILELSNEVNGDNLRYCGMLTFLFVC